MSAMNIMTAVRPATDARDAMRDNARDDIRAPRNDTRSADLRRADARRTNVRRTDERPDRDEPTTRRVRSNSPEFSALLALLAGAGNQVRADLLRQLPEESASLVDRLLQEAEGESAVEAVSLFDDNAPASTDEMQDASATSDAMRYGLLQQQGSDETASDVVNLHAYAEARRGSTAPQDEPRRALDGLARARSRLESMNTQEALDALARVSSRRGSSLEQLLALGDTRAASTRAQLDALIAKAGTPEGARLAAQTLLSDMDGVTSGVGSNAALEAVARRAQSGVASRVAQAHSHGVLAANTSVEDVSTANRSLDGLSPELRSRVERVIERMKNEYGHDVSIVETTRSQDRQNWLFEQGRTRQGPVVTWTRHSAHTRGEAVDVMIDGSWDNAQGFARLQRIAREEGLRTLGMKDPGHLELAGANAPADRNAEVRARVDARMANDAGSARGVASVAGVAGVAGVARVADSSATAATARTAMPGDGLSATQSLSAQASSNRQQSAGRGDRDASGGSLNNGKSDSRATRDADTSAIGAFGASAQAPGQTGVTGTARAAQVGASSASEQAERVSDIQQMRSDAPATPLTRMTLNVDNANGTQEKVTIDVRGNTVNTQITTDASTADRIRMRTADLQDALGRHGLESDRVRISTTKSQDTDTARAVSGERDAMRIGTTPQASAQDQSAGNGQRERTPARDYQDDARREQHHASDERQQRQDAPRPEFTLFGIES